MDTYTANNIIFQGFTKLGFRVLGFLLGFRGWRRNPGFWEKKSAWTPSLQTVSSFKGSQKLALMVEVWIGLQPCRTPKHGTHNWDFLGSR
jgi:hypothetical protein